MGDSMATREIYSLLRATIKSARTVGHLKLLINNQTIPGNMGRCLTSIGKSGPPVGLRGFMKM
jgi:hypothetical protein